MQVTNSVESGREKRWSGGDRRGSEQRHAGGPGAGSALPANASTARMEERESGEVDRGVVQLLTE